MALSARGVRGMLIPSAAPADWEALSDECAQLARIPAVRFAGFALGVHPWALSQHEEAHDDALFARLSLAIDVARETAAPLWAVGECGLDTGRRFAARPRQLAWVARHVALARRHALPLVLHAVGGLGTMLTTLDELRAPPSIIHGFTGAPEMALAYVRRGHRLGFGRALLDTRATRARHSAAVIPDHALLIETDTPVRPMPPPNEAKNASTLLDVARALADLRGVPVEAIAATTWTNAVSVFRLGGRA